MKFLFESKKNALVRLIAISVVLSVAFSCDTLDVDPDINQPSSASGTVYMM